MGNRNSSLSKHCPQSVAVIAEHLGSLFSACQVSVFHHGSYYFCHYGCKRDSLFDLASLTKVLVTTTLAAIAIDDRIIKLETPISRFFTNFPSDNVWIGHLLNHVAGFPAVLPLHEAFHTTTGPGDYHPIETPRQARLDYEQRILSSWQPEHHLKSCVYSDLGFMLLGWILEKAMGGPLDSLFQERITRRERRKTDYMNLQFIPTSPDVVPTSPMGPWRRDPICGDVHDDNAYILGGVAGHAGLFGSATQCVALALEWLQAIKSTDDAKHQGLLSPPTARLFWNTSYPSGQGRALGWDKKSTTATMSAAGEHLTPAARGHLGFTGTSLWIDPDHDLIITCLTNRVYLAKGETKQMDRAPMAAFRYKLHTLIAGELLNINTKRRSP